MYEVKHGIYIFALSELEKRRFKVARYLGILLCFPLADSLCARINLLMNKDISKSNSAKCSAEVDAASLRCK